jgi:hypothetical protein
MSENTQPISYRKPDSICRELNDWEKNLLSLDKKEFARLYMERIRKDIESHGLTLRLAETEDIIPVYNFIIHRFKDEYVEDISKYDLFRFIKYGHGLIVEDAGHVILGCLFEIGYEKKHKISYSIRLGVAERLKGKGLGRMLTVYSCLLAMEQGSHLKKGLINFSNFVSLHIHLNQAGWLVDSFYPDIKALGISFEFSLPLTPEAILNNSIDQAKLKRFIHAHNEGVDFRIIKSNDIEELRDIYQNDNFRIIAVLRSAEEAEGFDFIAMPIKNLQCRF